MHCNPGGGCWQCASFESGVCWPMKRPPTYCKQNGACCPTVVPRPQCKPVTSTRPAPKPARPCPPGEQWEMVPSFPVPLPACAPPEVDDNNYPDAPETADG